MRARRGARIEGTVQGVGFRPYVARLAEALALDGLVRNEGGTVWLEVEGPGPRLDAFARRLAVEAPPASRVSAVVWTELPVHGGAGFVIAHSQAAESPSIPVPPDLRVCDACLAEVRDPLARRHGYPFTNCTACGPRFTIISALPYDRERTSMVGFALCPACRAEFEDPGDRRYHAQPIACPECGPTLQLVNPGGGVLADTSDVLDEAARRLRSGELVALKGIGGYQLLADATSAEAIARLRERKHRPSQPFAVMVSDLESARALAELHPEEAEALASAAGPIVLVHGRDGALPEGVAPGLRRVGLMLPTTPLHALLLDRLERPLIVTSGNRHGAPIIIDDREARSILGPIVDALLVHDRPILRRCDDAVLHRCLGRIRTLRAGRGLVPRQLSVPGLDTPTLALGGHFKHAPAVGRERVATLWSHVADLDTPSARAAMSAAASDAAELAGVSPELLVTDAHPDYATTRWAEASGLPVRRVHHHHAHVAAVMAEHQLGAALGVAFDGAGLGGDGGAWGGEWLLVRPGEVERVARLRPFPLPGGDAAARDARRSLAGALVSAGLRPPASLAQALRSLCQLAERPRLSPSTSSAGRLFDAAACLAGLGPQATYEGELAMRLEALAEPDAEPLPFEVRETIAGLEVDWSRALRAMLELRGHPARLASRFHATLAHAIRAVVVRLDPAAELPVVLTGGCFANRLLCELTHRQLLDAGRETFLGELVPPGDGGLALGQLWIVASSTSSPASAPVG